MVLTIACKACEERGGYPFGLPVAHGTSVQAETTVQVDTPTPQPKMLKRVEPVYPFRALRDNLQGRVVIRFQIAPDGMPFNMTIVETPDPVFGPAALAALGQSRFEPEPPGKPIYAGRWFQQPYRFQIEDDTPGTVQTSP